MIALRQACLVLHGWPGTDHTYLRPGLDALADVGLHPAYVDYWDGGAPGRPSMAGLTMEHLADDVAALAAETGGGPVVVLGHAHGASVAMELAVRHPEAVRGLVLVSATPGQLGTTESLADLLDAPVVAPEVEVVQRVAPATDEELAATMAALAPFFVHPPDHTGSGRARELFARARFHAETARRWMQALSTWSAVDRLHQVTVPALVVAGAEDVVVPPSESARIGRLPGAEVVVLDGAGHLPWLEDADGFLAAVGAWLGSVASAGGRPDRRPPGLRAPGGGVPSPG
ncbi:MAG: alpha/beta fold hydrolase [Acidimicrobiales bacterium]